MPGVCWSAIPAAVSFRLGAGKRVADLVGAEAAERQQALNLPEGGVIAKALNITEATVKVHRKGVMKKTTALIDVALDCQPATNIC